METKNSLKGELDRLLAAIGVGAAYAWQREAFERLCSGDSFSQIKVPTAAGKTMIIPVFVAALAYQAARGAVTLPRRLVHVVNRRVLVDEASQLAQRLVDCLRELPELGDMKTALAGLSASGCPLVASTLRGGTDDNGAWSLDPSTPALVLANTGHAGQPLAVPRLWRRALKKCDACRSAGVRHPGRPR